MVTFPHGITDEEIETLSEQIDEEHQSAIHDLQLKRKKQIESGASKDDEEIRGIDEMLENI
jgi:hypothetical protein